MTGMRLRTKILLSLLITTLSLTTSSLLVVRHSIRSQVRAEILQDLSNSVATFQNVQRQREANLSRSAALLANLPTLKAVMTTRDALTIQDASAAFWRLSGSSLFVLADRHGKIMALHTTTPGFSRSLAQLSLNDSLQVEERDHWWFGGGHLYEVFLQPIFFGAPAHSTLLGVLAVGHEIDEEVAHDLSRVAASQVAFGYGRNLVASTLSRPQQDELVNEWARITSSDKQAPSDVQLGDERFLRASMRLSSRDGNNAVTLVVLKSYDQATMFLQRLNRMLAVLGMVTVVVGVVVVVLISHTFTRPLKNLVAGVRSLERGNFGYPLQARGADEVAEVTAAFVRMRQTLQSTQRQLLEAEQLATIGQMASSISHDLRHSLTAVVANAEFLAEGRLDSRQREELYDEIRLAVDQMTDLIESLLEFARTRESLRPVHSSLEELMRRTANAVRTHPEFRDIGIEISTEGNASGWFDPARMERVFHNLLLNACQAVVATHGSVHVKIDNSDGLFIIRVSDSGSGIAESIRTRLFRPFISHGKENGSGLGLAVVQKIVQDHGGEISVEATSTSGTTFKIVFPSTHRPAAVAHPESVVALARDTRMAM